MPKPQQNDGSNMLIAEAAAIAGRSVSWIRTHRTFGPLTPAVLNGRQAVTASSLKALVAIRPAKRHGKPKLRLVVDNTVK